MPPLTRWMLKSALLDFIAALIVGLALAVRGPLALPPWIAALTPVYIHLFMVGWVTQLIFGVVYWMFPKVSCEKPRGRLWLGWATFGLLNSGLLLRVVGEPLVALRPGSGWGRVLIASAGLQWLAGLAFVVNTWGRVKER